MSTYILQKDWISTMGTTIKAGEEVEPYDGEDRYIHVPTQLLFNKAAIESSGWFGKLKEEPKHEYTETDLRERERKAFEAGRMNAQVMFGKTPMTAYYQFSTFEDYLKTI